MTVPARRIAITARHGRAGRTTAAVNIAAVLADAGWQVLLVDVDPRGGASTALGLEAASPGLYHLLEDEAASDAIVDSRVLGLDVLGGDADLARAETTLSRRPGWQTRLSHVLDVVAVDYDAVVIDSAPGAGVLSIIGLAAADDVVIAATPTYLTASTLGEVMAAVDQARAFRPGLAVAGVVPSIVGGLNMRRDRLLEEFERQWSGPILPGLTRRVLFQDAADAGEPVISFAPQSAAAHEVRTLTAKVRGVGDARMTTAAQDAERRRTGTWSGAESGSIGRDGGQGDLRLYAPAVQCVRVAAMRDESGIRCDESREALDADGGLLPAGGAPAAAPRHMLHVWGVLDAEAGSRLGADITEALNRGAECVVVDLTDCWFVDLGGLTALIRAFEACQRAGCDMLLPGAAVVRRVLELCPLDTRHLTSSP